MRSRILCVLIGAALAWSCAPTPPPIGRALPVRSPEQEARIGSQADAAIRRELGTFHHGALPRDVQEAGARLAAAVDGPPRPWHFAILDAAAPNAFALPGGHVYVTAGLLPYLSSRAELAAALGHEMAHVVSGDDVRDDLAGSADVPADLGVFGAVARLFGRAVPPPVIRALFVAHAADDERRANALAATWLARAGFAPASMNVLLDTMDRLELETDQRGLPTWGATHGRGIRLEPATEKAPAPSPDDDFLAHLRTLRFGDDPRDGLVVGDEFLEASLRVMLALPAEWDVSSDRGRMIASAPGRDAFLVMQPVRAARRRKPAEIATLAATRAGLGAPSGGAATVGDLPAYVGATAGRVDGLGDVRARMACVRTPRGAFLVAGVAPAARYPDVESRIAAAVYSFRAMPPAAAARILPQRIDLERAKPGDTWDTIARRHLGVVMADTLAVLNHAAADRPPPAGTLLKVVIASEK